MVRADFPIMVLNHVQMYKLPSKRKGPCQEFLVPGRVLFVFLILCKICGFYSQIAHISFLQYFHTDAQIP